MSSVKIIATGKYVPKQEINNEILENENKLEKGYILKRSGIEKRYYCINDTLEDLAIKSVENMLNKYKNINIESVEMIITASTSYEKIMPSLSFKIQEYFNIKNCICLDILAGCSGYINALDIAQKYITSKSVSSALVIGAEILSKNIYDSINSKMLFGDGAGCTYLSECNTSKKYVSNIESFKDENQILTCTDNHELSMNGKEVYKFATTKTVENVKKLIEKSKEKIENIKYIIPHQSNIKIINKITQKVQIESYININEYGNTFCASIPIALDELFSSGQIKEKDKIILLGYGGGLNIGSILMEV